MTFNKIDNWFVIIGDINEIIKRFKKTNLSLYNKYI